MPGSANPWATELKSRTVTRRQNSSGGSTSGASTASSTAATAGAKPATSAADNGTSKKGKIDGGLRWGNPFFWWLSLSV